VSERVELNTPQDSV